MAFLFGTDDPTQRYEGEPLTWVQALIAAAVAFLAVEANLTTRRWPLPVSVAGAVLWLIGWGII